MKLMGSTAIALLSAEGEGLSLESRRTELHEMSTRTVAETLELLPFLWAPSRG